MMNRLKLVSGVILCVLVLGAHGYTAAHPSGLDQFVYLPVVLRPALPTITSFTANPATISPGQSSTLSWVVSGANSLEILPGIGPVTGSSIVVSPATTTQYTLVATNGAGSATAQTAVTVTAPPDEGALFLPALSNTDDPVLAIDASGGLHVAYNPTSPQSGGGYPVHYAYCPSNCDEAGSWTAVAVGDAGWLGDVARIALTPQGQPRIMWFFSDSLSEDGVYVYAECNANCTNPANWQSLPLTAAFVSTGEGRYFNLDPQGRPRYLYSGYFGPQNGLFYVFCDNGCADINNWYLTQISDLHPTTAFSLSYDDNGRIRLAFTDGSQWPPDWLSYAECDTACDDATNWHFTSLYELGDAYDFTLQIDSLGRPRLAVYAGYYGDDRDNRLHYFWCNTGCLTPGNWSSYDLGLPDEYGINVDLALDSQNRPRLAYATDIYYSEHVDYLWCTANCETGTAVWQSIIVETSAEVNASAPPGNCSLAYWYIGKRPSLVLDAADNPYLAYNADCGNVELVRFALFNQP